MYTCIQVSSSVETSLQVNSDFNCTTSVPESRVANVFIPKTVLQDGGGRVLLTVYTSPSLYPYTSTNNLTVNSPVVGVCINDLVQFVENITINFQLPTGVSFFHSIFV